MSLLQKFLKKDDMNKETQIDAIVKNLYNILNTKKNYGSFLKELGIGDYNKYQARDKIIETILQEIKQNIELYEPRVKLVDIKEMPSKDTFRIRFELSCIILNKNKPVYIILDSVSSKVMIED